MIQYQPDAVSGARRRPGTVSVAGMLLILIAASNAITLIITIATFDQVSAALVDSVFDTASGANSTPATRESAAHLLLGVQMTISGVLAVLFVLLSVFVVRGSQGMRVTTWVITGLGVICAGFGVLGGATRVSAGSASDPSSQLTSMADLGPSWAADVSIVQWIVVLLSLIAIIILLALPVSSEYYRKPQLAMYPMMGYGVPGYQAYPGQAYPAAYPQYPPYQPPPVDNVWPPQPPSGS